MITASHNPKEYNGIKLARKKWQMVSKETGLETIKRIYKRLKKSKLFDYSLKKKSRVRKIRQTSLRKEYYNYLNKFVKNKQGKIIKRKGLKKIKLVVDPGNGVGIIGAEFLKKLSLKKLEIINKKVDGNFPGRGPNPLRTRALRKLAEKVRRSRSTLGVAFDGDADRAVFVDENGKKVRTDLVGVLLLKEERNKKVVYDLRCGQELRKAIKEQGHKGIKSKVGRTHIMKLMRKEKADFGLELSGHYSFKTNHYFDSGIITLLYALRMLAGKEKSLGEMIKELNTYYNSGEINIKIKNKMSAEKAIKEIKKTYRLCQQSTLDGITVRNKKEDWWFNLRKSHTQPLMRLVVEAKNKEKMRKIKKKILQLIEKKNKRKCGENK